MIDYYLRDDIGDGDEQEEEGMEVGTAEEES